MLHKTAKTQVAINSIVSFVLVESTAICDTGKLNQWLRNKLSKFTKTWKGRVIYKRNNEIIIFDAHTQQEKQIYSLSKTENPFFHVSAIQSKNGNIIIGNDKTLHELKSDGTVINHVELTSPYVSIVELYNGDILVGDASSIHLLSRSTFTVIKTLSCSSLYMFLLESDRIMNTREETYIIFDLDLNILQTLHGKDSKMSSLLPVLDYKPPCFEEFEPQFTSLEDKNVKRTFTFRSNTSLSNIQLLDDGRSIVVHSLRMSDHFCVVICGKEGVLHKLPGKQRYSRTTQLDQNTIVYVAEDKNIVVCDINSGVVKETFKGIQGEEICFLLE
jgi:hypothetical protein